MFMSTAETPIRRRSPVKPGYSRFMQADPLGYEAGMNLYGYVGGDPVNRTDPSGMEEQEIVVTGRRWQEIVVTGGQGGSFNWDFSLSGWVSYVLYDSGLSLGGGGSGSSSPPCTDPACVDAIVVTARRRGRVGNVRIDFDLPYPQEQIWIYSRTQGLIDAPSTSRDRTDRCGRSYSETTIQVGAFPQDTIAVVHTHTNSLAAYPFTGDYQLSGRYSVYGITPDSVWVLRPGASMGSRPEVLWGSNPGTMPRPRGRVRC